MPPRRPSCCAVRNLLVTWAVLGVASQVTPSSDPLKPSPPSASPSPPPLKSITFVRIVFLCEYLYSARYGSYDGVTDAVMPYNNSLVTVVGEERFVNICLPYYNHIRSDQCVEKPFILACLFDDIVFLHGHGCSSPSLDDTYFDQLLANTLLEEDEQCFQAVCSGEVRVVRQEVEGYTVHLLSPVTLHSACHKYLLLFYPTEKDNSAQTVIQNVHWASCFAGYDVVWSHESGDGSGGGGGEVITTWSYLPLHCRVKEQVLAVVMTLVVVGGVVGNMLVLIAFAWRGHQRGPMGILYVSLAAAELLVCAFVLAPGLHVHLRVMRGTIDEEQLSPGGSRGSNAELLLDVGMEHVREGFLILSAHVLNVGCGVSMPTVLLLAMEQCLAVDGRSLQEDLTMRRTRGFVVASWSFGVLVSVALVYGGGAFWYSFYKLPLSIPPGEPEAILAGVAVILGLISGATIVLSFVAVWRTCRGRALVSINQDATPTRVLLTAVLHLVSAGTAGAAFLLPLTSISRPHLEGTRFLCWWGFLTYTCWHPWLLILSSRNFRDSVITLTARCRLSWLRVLVGTQAAISVTPSPPPSPRPPTRPGPKLAPGRRRRYLPGVRYYK